MASTTARRSEAPISTVRTLACTIPTDLPEADGTLAWDSTTVVFVEVEAGGETGLGYTFTDASIERIVRERLTPLLEGADPFDVGSCQEKLLRATRNLGRPGLMATALSALDVALWDLKAKLLGVSLTDLFGSLRDGVALYGSSGFTSYSNEQLYRSLAAYREQGITAVKMKVGANLDEERERLARARSAVGSHCTLMVDANGAYSSKAALHAAELFAEYDVRWFEEPVSSDDLAGLRLLKEHAPHCLQIAAGEYACDLYSFRALLEGPSVDVLQLDATRCLGYTGFLKGAALAEAFHVPISAHTAPYLHVPCCMAASGLLHVEYFHDHVRIAEKLLDGPLPPKEGQLRPDPTRPGHGLSLRHADADKYRHDRAR